MLLPSLRTGLHERAEGIQDMARWFCQDLSVDYNLDILLGLPVETGEIINRAGQVKAGFNGPGDGFHLLHREFVVLYLKTQEVQNLQYDSFPDA